MPTSTLSGEAERPQVAGAVIEAGGSHAGGDGLVDADARLPLQESHAPRVGVFSGTARVHDGALQCAGPVAGLTAHRVGLRAPLDRGV